MANHFLPMLAKCETFLNKKVNIDNFGKTQDYDYIPILQNKFMDRSALLQVIILAQNKESTLKSLLFDLSVSFLKLFNKASSRLIYGTCLRKLKPLLESDEYYMCHFDYLYNINQGMQAKTEIIKLKSCFQYFYGNYLLTCRETENKEQGTAHFERISLPTERSKKVSFTI